VGNVASLLANLDVTKVQRQEKLARLSSFVRRHKLPDDLQRRIFDYYHYLWERGRGADETDVVTDLPGGLRTDVYLFMNHDIIETVPLFAGAGEALVRHVVQKLEPVVFTPGEHVFRKGDAGRRMYFITAGAVEVLGEVDQEVLATLGPGNYFGEMALLTSEPRNASVRAREYCEMYTLEKSAFEELLARHPEIADKVHALASERASGGADD
jgi:voltage-gated potassium channel